MNKPTKNTVYTVLGIEIQHYTNGSFAYFDEEHKSWRNISPWLGKKLLELRKAIKN